MSEQQAATRSEVKTQIPIEGMTCAACANRIEKGLGKLPGVKEANVNFAMERATLTYNPGETGPEHFEKKVSDLGYKVKKERVDLDITGMTCAACSARIEKC